MIWIKRRCGRSVNVGGSSLGIKPQLKYSVLVVSSLKRSYCPFGQDCWSDKAYFVYYTFPVTVKLGGDLKVNLDWYGLGL